MNTVPFLVYYRSIFIRAPSNGTHSKYSLLPLSPVHNFPFATAEEINTIVHTEVRKLSFDSNLGMPSISLTSLDKLKLQEPMIPAINCF